jgi:hypothetical protein
MKENRCKEGIEDAYNILYNDCFIYKTDNLESSYLNPEETLMRHEAANGKTDKHLSRRAKSLIEFSMKTYPTQNITPTKIFQMAKKEMRWTEGILRETIKEAKTYVRSILG